jgi:hypothetical protein
MSEVDDKHYLRMDSVLIDKAFVVMDDAMAVIFNEHKLNMFEALTVLEYMATKLRRNNIDQFMLETCNRFSKNMNEDDSKLK